MGIPQQPESIGQNSPFLPGLSTAAHTALGPGISVFLQEKWTTFHFYLFGGKNWTKHEGGERANYLFFRATLRESAIASTLRRTHHHVEVDGT